jgi:ABC-type transport system involved in multi-copper enzyme maturation permease subunit
MRGLLTVAHLTIHEARRRRIVAAAVACGAVFLAVFWVASYFAYRAMLQNTELAFVMRQALLASLTAVGLFATNFLCALLAALLPVDALAGEIDSGVMQTLASKPIRRADIIGGKWLAHSAIVSAYLLFLVGGVLLASRVIAGYVALHVGAAFALMLLENALLVSASIAGGTRLSTVTNGVVVLGWYGIAFFGGWIEKFGTMAGLGAVQNVGIVASLVSPSDSLWRLASFTMLPAAVRTLGPAAIINGGSVPSALMVWWAAGFMIVLLVWAVRSFQRRAL